MTMQRALRRVVAAGAPLLLLAVLQPGPAAARPAAGDGVLGGRITIVGDSPPGNFRAFAVRPDGRSAYAPVTADGQYEFGTLSPGVYRVQIQPHLTKGVGVVWLPGTADESQSPWLTVAADSRTEAPVTTVPVGVITGRITTADGAPCANDYVVIARSDAESPREDEWYVRTDSAGRYRYDGIVAGRYKVGVRVEFDGPFRDSVTQWAPGRWVRTKADVFDVGPAQTLAVDQRLLPRPGPGAIAGRLVVVGGVSPTVFQVYPEQRLPLAVPVARDGSYELNNLAPGDYRLRFDGGAVEESVPEGRSWLHVDAGAELRLGDVTVAVGSVSGRITSPTGGRPPSGLRVALRAVPGAAAATETAGGGSLGLTGATDDDGYFRFSAVRPGRYQVGFGMRSLPNTKITQWIPGKRTQAEAAIFTVGVGDPVTIADEPMLPKSSTIYIPHTP